MSLRKNKVIFLDRDGTINVDKGYVHRQQDWEWIPGAVVALKQLAGAGFRLVVVSNQSGIGHGLYAESDVRVLHTYMEKSLAQHGVVLDAIAYCPHRREAGCSCRKPRTGLAHEIEQVIGPIDYAASWTVGDKVADICFGQALGTRTALIHSRYWNEVGLVKKPDAIVDSLLEAATIIREHSLHGAPLAAR